MTDLSGKVALVTGGGRGIGRAIARKLAEQGADVAVVSRDLSPEGERFGEVFTAPTVAEEIQALGRRGLGIEGDLRLRETADRVVAQTVAELGRLDILVNNAGGARTPVDRSYASLMPDEDMDELMEVNYLSTVYCSQAAVPALRATGGGSIVNISSRAGLDASVQQGRLAPYGIAKAAVHAYTRYLAAEVGKDGIRVNAVSPGVVATARIMATAKERGIGTEKDLEIIPLRRFAEPEDIAGAVLYFSSALSSYVTGQVLSVCGGVVLMPS